MAKHENRPILRLPLGITLLAVVAFAGMVLKAVTSAQSATSWETAGQIAIAAIWLACFFVLHRRRPPL